MTKSIAILLCTFNGEKFLQEQLNSFTAQTYSNWTLWASDDGSTDNTRALLKDFADCMGHDRVKVIDGPQEGFAANFLHLLSRPEIKADYFAFSDQDDVWHPEKIERSLNVLSTLDAEKPNLYCSRTELIDKSGKTFGYSPFFTRPPSFQNALVQSLAGGNTMIFNDITAKLGSKLNSARGLVISHDWSLYQLVSGAGGEIYYDEWPSTKYRQHRQNAIGSNLTIGARINRFYRLLRGSFKNWNTQNIDVLLSVKESLLPEARCSLESFTLLRSASFRQLLTLAWSHEFYRHTKMGNLALVVSLFLRKI